jgi:TolB protein
MTRMSPRVPRPVRALAALVSLAALATRAPEAAAQSSSPPPDDSVLGTVEVDGSAGGIAPRPKLGLVPTPPAAEADKTAREVVRNDLDLSGAYEVLVDDKAPDPAATRDSLIDLAAWRGKGAEAVVRLTLDPTAPATTPTLVAEAYLTAGAAPLPAGADASAAPKPLYRGTFPVPAGASARAASHRATDALLGALTGRPGAFASRLAFAQRAGRWQTAQTIDPDGFGQALESPTDSTVMSPAFGPGGRLFYLLSRDYAPFRVATGAAGTILPFNLPGSALGLAFSPDGTRTAVTVMRDGKSLIMVGEPNDAGKLTAAPAAPLAHHPAFGPLGKMAYVGGSPVQRVYVDGAPVSPGGFMASAPSFCDTAQGLLLVFTVEVQGGAELVATDTRGGGLRRLTQRQGENRYPACSPDGRMVAFFSTTKTGAGPGLYVMPVLRPWMARKVASGAGLSVVWERLPPAK